jgi:hypothetical protein
MRDRFSEESISGIKTKLCLPLFGVWPVTFETMVRKNWPNVPIEVDTHRFSRRNRLDKAANTDRRCQSK